MNVKIDSMMAPSFLLTQISILLIKELIEFVVVRAICLFKIVDVDAILIIIWWWWIVCNYISLFLRNESFM